MQTRKTKDTTPAILVVILLFCIPRHPLGPFPSEALLNWSSVQSRLAWGVILLRGGGFSMANVATVITAAQSKTTTTTPVLNQTLYLFFCRAPA